MFFTFFSYFHLFQSKAIQNGKMNGSTTNKVSISSVKKKDIEKSANEKPVIEKSSAEKKVYFGLLSYLEL